MQSIRYSSSSNVPRMFQHDENFRIYKMNGPE